MSSLVPPRGDGLRIGRSYVFYHRTTEEAWKKIKTSGELWGVMPDFPTVRYTWISTRDHGTFYGRVLLAVRYTPSGASGVDSFPLDLSPEVRHVWFAVFNPIPITDVRRVDRAVFDGSHNGLFH